MNSGKSVKALVIGIGLLLSACTVEPGYSAPPYAYDGYAPIEGSYNFDYGTWDYLGRDHDHGGHGFAHHAGFGGGHHGSSHGGGGRGGGGHR
jgi:hypothetical protein